MSDILTRYPHDSEYIKYNWITLSLQSHTKFEMAVLEEMLLTISDTLTYCPEGSIYYSSGSPYFFQGNYRLMYFPHKFKTHRYTELGENDGGSLRSFSTYQQKSEDKAFNDIVIFKREKRRNYNTYYAYLDELMHCANMLMDGIIYNERKVFIAYLACLNPKLKVLLFHQHLLSPDYFPFVEMMNLIVFNRHLNNY